MKKFLLTIFTALSLVSCVREVVPVDKLPDIFPDYIGVTIPSGIAPLDFAMSADTLGQMFVKVKGSISGEMTAKGEWADFDIKQWHRLTEANKGGKLYFTVAAQDGDRWLQFKDFIVYVSNYELEDYGITYRKLAPGYTTYSKIGIYQRDIHTFDEEPIITSTLVPGQCVGCHTANHNNSGQFMFHARGKHGATLLQKDGERKWVTTKTDETIGNVAYTYWHPSGDWFVGSINPVRQSFWTGNERWIEVYDLASDVVVMDVRTDELIVSPLLTSEMLETSPVFSADGKWIYFCRAKAFEVPAHVDSVRYDLCRIAFNPEDGTLGEEVETVIPAASQGRSITFPRPSFDGRYMLYCVTDFSIFPIDHKEADLWMLDLATGKERRLDEVNSDCSESFHNWSGNSRWFLFSSRRGDGLYGCTYFTSVDDEGRCTKPFLLPQRNPKHFYHTIPYSFNVPDFTAEKVEFDTRGVYKEVMSDERVQAKVRK